MIHLACTSSWATLRDVGDKIHDIAVGGTRNVLEAAKAAGVGCFVHVSSLTAVNGSDEPVIFDESATYEIADRGLKYSLAKHYAEQLVLNETGVIDTVVVAPGEVYGEGDDDLVTAETLMSILNSSPAAACDGGTAIVHADDVAAGILAALERGRRNERYILAGDNLSIHDLVLLTLKLGGRRSSVVDIPNDVLRRLCHLMHDAGLEPPISLDVIDYATMYWFADSTKARTELGWTFRNAEDTLEPVIKWLRETGRVT